jgi:hypothetical protein
MKKNSILLVGAALILIGGLFVAGCVSDAETTGSEATESAVTPDMAQGNMTGQPPGDMPAGNMTGQPPEGMPAGNMTGEPPEDMHRGNMTDGERPSGTPPATPSI